MAARVLIADDDRAIRDSLATALRLQGYEPVTCPDGVQALATVRRQAVDVLILDVMMPGIDGLAVAQVLRAEGDRTPILMLTARVETPDRVAGLDAGADDYLAKPFELDELLARLRALLRRAGSTGGPAGLDPPWSADAADPPRGTAGREVHGRENVLQVASVRLDPAARRVWQGAEEVELSKTEFDLLELLMANAGIVLEHSTIYDRIWGYDFGPDSKNLAVYVSYLRRKLDRPGDSFIRTVRGVGYSVREP